jgi:hypothetical protein
MSNRSSIACPVIMESAQRQLNTAPNYDTGKEKILKTTFP